MKKRILKKMAIAVLSISIWSISTPQLLTAQDRRPLRDSVRSKKDSSLLSTKHHKLEEVKVQGLSIIQRLKVAPLSIEVIDLKERYAQTGNLADILNRAPGVKIRTSGALGDQFTINMNGLEGKAIQIYKDGIPLSFYGHGFQPSLISANLLNRVEIYKGILPIHLGADALGGAINFVSRYPTEPVIDVSYETGSFNTQKATASFYIPLKNNSFYVGGNLGFSYSENNYKRDFETYDIHNYGFINDTTRRRFENNAVRAPLVEAYVGISGKPWADDIKLILIGTEYYKRIPTLSMIGTAGNALYTFAKDRTFTPMLKYQKSFWNGKLDFNLLGGYSRSKTIYRDTSHFFTNVDSEGNTYKIKKSDRGELSTFGSVLDLKFNMYTARFTAGYEVFDGHKLEFSHIYTDNNRKGSDSLTTYQTMRGSDPFAFPSRYIKHISALGWTSKLFRDKLELIAAGKRYNMFSSGYSTFGRKSGGDIDYQKKSYYGGLGGFSFQFDDRFILKSSYEYSTRLPDDFELFGDSYQVGSNLQLKPERSHNLNAQFIYTNTKERAGAFSLMANYFQRNTTERIYLMLDIPVMYFRNRAITKIWGFELDAHYQPFDFLFLGWNGTFQNIEIYRTLKLDSGEKESKPIYKGREGGVPPIFAHLITKFQFDNLLHPKSRTEVYWYWDYTHRFSLHGELLGEGDGYVPKLFERLSWDIVNNPDKSWWWLPGDRRLGQENHTVGLSHYLPARQASISLECSNLLNERLYDNFRIEKPGRAFFVKLRWELTKRNQPSKK